MCAAAQRTFRLIRLPSNMLLAERPAWFTDPEHGFAASTINVHGVPDRWFRMARIAGVILHPDRPTFPRLDLMQHRFLLM